MGIAAEVAPSRTSRNARAEKFVRSPWVIVPTKSGGKKMVMDPVSELAVSRNRRPASLVLDNTSDLHMYVSGS